MAWFTVLGIPAAIYIASIIALLFQMQDMATSRFAVVGSGLLAMGIYVFHRTSVQRSDHMQPRHLLAMQYRRGLNITAVVILLIATVILAMHHPLTPILILGSGVGVVLYGRRMLLTPVRHYKFVKPLAVGGSIALLAWILTGMSLHVIPAIVIAMICSADALLCDLDDRIYDTSTNCFTLAFALGTRGTWIAAALVYLFAGVGLILFCAQSTLGMLLLILFPLPMLCTRFGLRTCIDLRPLLVLLLAWIL